MSKAGEGSWKSGDDGGSGMYGRVETAKDGQSNYYVGSTDTGRHCHGWSNPNTGKSGVEHRGHCKVCKDEESAGSK